MIAAALHSDDDGGMHSDTGTRRVMQGAGGAARALLQTAAWGAQQTMAHVAQWTDNDASFE
jgi:shikimate 5-dehydrogenase